jgi:NTE family protein
LRSRGFRARCRGLLERTFARLADGEGATEADLLSYLLFDGRFARELIDLGWHDAARAHDGVMSFFAAPAGAAARAG